MGLSRNNVLLTVLALTVSTAFPTPRLTARALAGGTIVGVITTKEAARPALKVTIDPEVCGATVPDESVIVDTDGHVANAVVTVTGVKGAAPAEVALSNEKCRFVPHVGMLRPAGIVKVLSRDSVLHTTHAQMTGGGKFLFNVSLPIPNMALSKAVDKAGVVQLVCNTHNWMRGWLVVTSELSAMSGADGAFRLDGVPAGPQEIRIWHEALKAAPAKVTVKDGEIATVNVVLAR